MYCPQCGSTQLDELKFCKACGVNLVAVRKAVAAPDSVGKFSWDKTWIAEMMASPVENVRRAAEIERLQGITPETKRLNEIKAGVITASVGVGVMLTVFMVMQGIILGGFVPPAVAQILSRVWIAGVIPLLVGVSLIINGTFISKKGVPQPDIHRTDEGAKERDRAKQFEGPAAASFLPPKAETSQLERDIFSVTDETTRHLEEPMKVKKSSGN